MPRPRWQALAKAGARPQRLLWASTSAKDKSFSPIKYVEELIGPNTVNTAPLETINAYRQSGKPQLTLRKHIAAIQGHPRRAQQARYRPGGCRS